MSAKNTTKCSSYSVVSLPSTMQPNPSVSTLYRSSKAVKF